MNKDYNHCQYAGCRNIARTRIGHLNKLIFMCDMHAHEFRSAGPVEQNRILDTSSPLRTGCGIGRVIVTVTTNQRELGAPMAPAKFPAG